MRLYEPRVKAHYSINQIAKKLGKTYPYIYQTVQGLLEREVLVATPVGRSHLCTLNLRSDECIAILTLNALEERKKALKSKFVGAVLEAVKRVSPRMPIWTALLVGETVYLVTCPLDEDEEDTLKHEIPYSALVLLSVPQLRERLRALEETELREERVLLHGFANYYGLLASIEDRLQYLYSPLRGEP